MDSLRSQIDSALAEFLDEVRGVYAQNSAEGIVDEVIRATVPKGGRIRPLLCCLGYAAVRGEGGASDPRIVKAAASVELLHTFAIIHDDVMDGSPMRRGEPSIHRRLADERKAAGGRDAELHGISLAILAGDLALVASDLLFSRSGFSQDVLVNAYEPLSAMRLDAIAGQYLDLTHSGSASGDRGLALRIAGLKTGSYSVEGPVVIGATLAGGSPRQIDSLRQYGRALGTAFQMADDLKGLFGDPAVTGKDIENDIRRGKPTSLISRALAAAESECAQVIRSVWGNPEATTDDLALLRAAVRDSGAQSLVVKEIDRLVYRAVKALESSADELKPSACQVLRDLATKVAQPGI